MEEQKMTYDAAFQELQQILAALQDAQVRVDELSEKVTRANELIRFCRERLRQTEEEIEGLLEK
jgi:exodeoxyribonuclease VII small subunit